ncbi:MAG: hypothetical protein ACRDHZ_07670 [Ktedonobacteraceae bacterium]
MLDQHRFDNSANSVLMSESDFERLISDETDFRYELIGGLLYNITGSSPEHSDIAGQIEFLLKLQLGRKGSGDHLVSRL